MFDPRYQHGAHTPLCGHAHWRSKPKAQIGFIAAESEREKGNSLENTSRFMMNIWKSPLTEQRGGREGEKTCQLSLCALAWELHDGQGFSCPGHYSIKEEPGVRGLTQALSSQAFTADIPERGLKHPGDKPGVNPEREPHTSRCSMGSLAICSSFS